MALPAGRRGVAPSQVDANGIIKDLFQCNLIWENASPTSSFAAQDVAVDLTQFRFVQIVINRTTSVSGSLTSAIIPITHGTSIVTPLNYFSTGNTQARTSRDATISDSKISFSIGMSGNVGASGSSSATAAIPIAIYGIK